jgi:hypothetical protein
VVLAHPCLEIWLGELLESTSSSAFTNSIYASKQKRGEYEKSLLPSLVKTELRNRADLPKFVENFHHAYLLRRRLRNGLKIFELHR